jgi:hypothetical protein
MNADQGMDGDHLQVGMPPGHGNTPPGDSVQTRGDRGGVLVAHRPSGTDRG